MPRPIALPEAGQDAFLQAMVDAGLRIVAITDHMKSAYACELAGRAADRDDITVFPGVEVSCLIAPAHANRIHVLAIFPPGTSYRVARTRTVAAPRWQLHPPRALLADRRLWRQAQPTLAGPARLAACRHDRHRCPTSSTSK